MRNEQKYRLDKDLMLQAYQDIEPEARHLSFSMTKRNKLLTQENVMPPHSTASQSETVQNPNHHAYSSQPPQQKDQCIAYRVTSITLVTREECGAGAHRISPT